MQPEDIPHMGLDAAIGFRIDSIAPQRVTGSLPVTTDVLAADGSVHRGVLSSAIESVASVAAAAHIGDTGRVVGVANSTSYFATASSGTVTATAEPVSLQADRQDWVVRVTDDAGRLLAQGNVQLVNVLNAATGDSWL
jgi:1,4-dihydroxy-2-naphthoyl-CoA hydrolase